MQDQLQIFENEEFGQVRVLDIDGQPWFVGKDVSSILGYRNGRDALRVHVDDEDKADVVIHDGRQNRSMAIINESGLYSLILSSKLPSAKRFKRWVTSEVLPSIRKHGAYISDAVLEEAIRSQDFAFELFQKLQSEKGKTAALLDKLEEIAPKARYYDLILQSEDAAPVSVIAKDYGMTAIAFNRLLHDLDIQYRVGSCWVLYRTYDGLGYTKSRTYYIPNGSSVIHTCWTQRGRIFLYDTLLRNGIAPMREYEHYAI